MARLKFFIFAVICVGIAVAGLISSSESTSSLARIQTSERLGWGQQLFESSFKLAQALRTAALSEAASDAALVRALTPAPASGAAAAQSAPANESAATEAAAQGQAQPSAEAIDAARTAVTTSFARLPEELRSAAAILVSTAQGVATIPAGGAAPETKPAGAFALAEAAEAGPMGTHALVDGKLYRVVAVPVRSGEHAAALLGAAFLVDDGFAAQQAAQTTLGVTVVAGDLIVSSLSGAERDAAAKARDGQLAMGSFANLGPLSLPIFAGKATRFEAGSFAIDGIEGARVVLTAEVTGLVALADFQKKALLGIGALVLLSLAFLLIMGSPKAVAAVEAQTEQPPPVQPQAEQASPSQSEAEASPDSLFGDQPPAPAVTPDDFPFGDSAPAAPAPEPVQEAEAVLEAQPEPEPPLDAAPAIPDFDALPMPGPQYAPAEAAVPVPGPASTSPFDAAPQAAADSLMDQPFDPFAAAAAQLPEDEGEEEQRHEATVVAAVPAELLRAATRARPAGAPITTPVQTQALADAIPLPAPSAPADPDEAHFQDVFNQFVATRAQCNEPADGLTLDKFLAKLRKNRDQLVQKYNCKSVRFQVYVKEGKAALKATPVRE
ncbi:MAG TPA: hypothetical protein DFS52_13295 [Myxococcales bacterium]|nr:hypothetical protein [Myxococcales bacterium]